MQNYFNPQLVEQFITKTDKPSKLIRVALDDLKIVRELPGYRINMSDWHSSDSYYGPNTCLVCFAGCTMVNQLKLNKNVEFEWFSWENKKDLQLLSRFDVLNEARSLSLKYSDWEECDFDIDVEGFRNFIHTGYSDFSRSVEAFGYSANPEYFMEIMEKQIALLEQHGF